MDHQKIRRAGFTIAMTAALICSLSCSKKPAPQINPEEAAQNPGLNHYDYSLKSKHPYDYRRVGI